jgi:DNA-binding transcriptional MerR regulator
MKLKTIQELAKMSGVSVRTLRYYDEIGLLSPKIQMENGRSFYGIKELLYLIQILNLKEFGFSLNKIKSILHDKPAHKLSKLTAQKKILIKKLDRLKTGLQTIESMIQSTKEKPMLEMTPEQIETQFEQIRSKKEYAKYFDEAFLEEKAKQSQEQFRLQAGDEYYEVYLSKGERQNLLSAQEYGQKYGAFLNKLGKAIENKLCPESEETQILINEQWEILQMAYPETRAQKIYFAIRDQICDFPGEEALALRDYLFQAMTIFGERHFS